MEEKYFENQKFEELKFDAEQLEGYEFFDCEFDSCVFNDCKITRCRLSNCKFNKCSITNIETKSTYISDTEFFNCNLMGVNWSVLVPSGHFSEPISKIQNCNLKYNTFINMTFRKIQFNDNTIIHSTFGECKLVESGFKNCKLDRTEFIKCDLRKADFRDATGYEIDVFTNTLRDARFSFPEAINLLNSLNIRID